MLKYTDILPLMILFLPLVGGILSYLVPNKRSGLIAVITATLILVYSVSAFFYIPFETGLDLDWIT
ncbi:MAG: hypothetical protein ABJO02_16415, partial [Reichenbachiella sp.]